MKKSIKIIVKLENIDAINKKNFYKIMFIFLISAIIFKKFFEILNIQSFKFIIG